MIAKAVGEIVVTDLPDGMRRIRFHGNSGATRGWYFADSMPRCSDLPTDNEADC